MNRTTINVEDPVALLQHRNKLREDGLAEECVEFFMQTMVPERHKQLSTLRSRDRVAPWSSRQNFNVINTSDFVAMAEYRTEKLKNFEMYEVFFEFFWLQAVRWDHADPRLEFLAEAGSAHTNRALQILDGHGGTVTTFAHQALNNGHQLVAVSCHWEDVDDHAYPPRMREAFVQLHAELAGQPSLLATLHQEVDGFDIVTELTGAFAGWDDVVQEAFNV